MLVGRVIKYPFRVVGEGGQVKRQASSMIDMPKDWVRACILAPRAIFPKRLSDAAIALDQGRIEIKQAEAAQETKPPLEFAGNISREDFLRKLCGKGNISFFWDNKNVLSFDLYHNEALAAKPFLPGLYMFDGENIYIAPNSKSPGFSAILFYSSVLLGQYCLAQPGQEIEGPAKS